MRGGSRDAGKNRVLLLVRGCVVRPRLKPEGNPSYSQKGTSMPSNVGLDEAPSARRTSRSGISRFRRRMRDALLSPSGFVDLLRICYGIIPLLRGDPRIVQRAHLQILLRATGRLIRRARMQGCYVTERGECYLAMPDGLFLAYNVADGRFTRGAGQSVDFVCNAADARVEQFIFDQLRDGDAYFDVGANNGYFYALKVARRYPGVRVFAFEPDPRILDHLRRNVAINKLGNVTIVPAALAETSSPRAITALYGASNFLIAGAAASGEQDLVTVDCRSLDDFVTGETAIDPKLIKVDIEGGEFAFLRGAAACIERCRPVLVMELDDRWLRRSGSSLDETLTLLERLRYKCFRVAGTTDAIAIPLDRMGSFPAGGEAWLSEMTHQGPASINGKGSGPARRCGWCRRLGPQNRD